MNILLWQAAVLPGQEQELEFFANTGLLQFFQQQLVLVLAFCNRANNSSVSATGISSRC